CGFPVINSHSQSARHHIISPKKCRRERELTLKCFGNENEIGDSQFIMSHLGKFVKGWLNKGNRQQPSTQGVAEVEGLCSMVPNECTEPIQGGETLITRDGAAGFWEKHMSVSQFLEKGSSTSHGRENGLSIVGLLEADERPYSSFEPPHPVPNISLNKWRNGSRKEDKVKYMNDTNDRAGSNQGHYWDTKGADLPGGGITGSERKREASAYVLTFNICRSRWRVSSNAKMIPALSPVLSTLRLRRTTPGGSIRTGDGFERDDDTPQPGNASRHQLQRLRIPCGGVDQETRASGGSPSEYDRLDEWMAIDEKQQLNAPTIELRTRENATRRRWRDKKDRICAMIPGWGLLRGPGLAFLMTAKALFTPFSRELQDPRYDPFWPIARTRRDGWVVPIWWLLRGQLQPSAMKSGISGFKAKYTF
ncbi:9356_t:CDS:10, partial [Acaulospora colombiana]